MTLLPRSLFGRIVIVLVVGLLAVQFISLIILLNERAHIDLNARAQRAAQRVGDTVRIFDSLSPADRATMAPLISSRAFSVVTGDEVRHYPLSDADEGSSAHVFSAELRKELGENRLVASGLLPVPLDEDKDTAAETLRSTLGEVSADPLGAEVLLADGRLASFTWVPSATATDLPPRVLTALAVQLVVIVALTLLAVRWATRPLSDLADAAERLGGNANSPPLDETGSAEVQHAARAFNRMQTRIQAHLRDRLQLLAAISHDLKTPITRLRLRSELLAEEPMREKFDRDLQELEEMVVRALEFARDTDAREPVQPINVVALVESLQEDYQETGAIVDVEGTAESYVGRPLAIKRCLRNLIDNALKYGGQARIILADTRKALTIRVRDRGAGIPEEFLERVFEPFFRLEESRNRDTGGTGLGLSIARSVAEAHFGTLELRNVPEGGLEASLTFPRPAEAA